MWFLTITKVVVKEDKKKRGLCINDAQDRNKRRDDAAEEWSTPVNWDDSAIKAERRSQSQLTSLMDAAVQKTTLSDTYN